MLGTPEKSNVDAVVGLRHDQLASGYLIVVFFVCNESNMNTKTTYARPLNNMLAFDFVITRALRSMFLTVLFSGGHSTGFDGKLIISGVRDLQVCKEASGDDVTLCSRVCWFCNI